MKSQSNMGLEDISAGASAICAVGVHAEDLTYRGYSIDDLTEFASYEEVAYLLIHGELPASTELSDYRKQLCEQRQLPVPLKALLELIPKTAHPMDVLRSVVSVLGTIEPETLQYNGAAIADRVLALLPSALAYWYRYHFFAERIELNQAEQSFAEALLTYLLNTKPTPLQVEAINASLILYAEHEFNASTFAARVTASTLSDFYSALTSAIGTLRGPLHGGANEAAIELIEDMGSLAETDAKILSMLALKKKIMGFGHRVYRTNDPRSSIIETFVERLAVSNEQKELYAIAKRIEEILWKQKKLFPNVDFYSSLLYTYCGIPTSLFTPLFVIARTAGWSAHILEQRAHNRLIRPKSEYIGPSLRPFIAINDRVSFS